MSSSLILLNNSEPFFNQIVMCDEKWILYENQQWPGQWLDREEAPKALSKAKLRPKKGHGHRWSAAHLIYYSFLNPRKTITSEKYAQQIDEMHGKLQGLQPALVNKKGPIILCDNAGLHIKVLRYPPYSSTSCNWLPLFQASWQLFAGKMLPQSAVCRKRFPRVCSILKHRFLCYRNKQTYFSLGKMYWL